MAASPTLDFSQTTSAQRRTLVAAALGWMLDAFAAMLYALVLSHLLRDLGMSKATSGLLYTLTLLASGIGGLLFGWIADQVGRKRALMLSILTYSVCSFASGLSTSVVTLAVSRCLLGLGMGGEWNTGAALVAETWPDAWRARALSIVQSSWAIGYALAALVTGIVLRYYSWRVVFFVGILPGLVVLWIQKSVPESEVWRKNKLLAQEAKRNTGNAEKRSSQDLRRLFQPPFAGATLALLFANFFGLFAWWGLFTWIPPYLSLPVEQGGRGFGIVGSTTLLLALNLLGMFPGYISYGWVADRFGRRVSFVAYTLIAAMLVPLYAAARQPWVLLTVGVVIAFFGTGFFSGSGVLGSEIFPTQVRAFALGLTYSGARALSSVAPFVIGRVGEARGLDSAFYLCAGSFLLAAAVATRLPETRGKHLE
jgi:MFS family permease